MTDKNPLRIKVCLDSRLVNKDEYFVPVIGESADDHEYIEKARQNGAAGMVELINKLHFRN